MSRLVIKIGSNLLANEQRGLDTEMIQSLAKDISAVTAAGYQVAVVSSGAVAAGMKKLGLKSKPKEIRLKQAAAAIGQSSLMWAYEKEFSRFNGKVAQVLLTREDFSDRAKYINVKNTLTTLLSYGIVPVINENDTVATDEIKFGDNDNLAALVAILLEAEKLIILSDVEGLYREDPRKNAKAELIHAVETITPEIEKMAGGAGSAVGTGGMYSKILAARKATAYGVNVHIVSGKRQGQIVALMQGVHLGTVFKCCSSRLSHRKGWIAYSTRSKGTLAIDDGAVKALVEGRKSLLPSGIVSVQGDFDIGDSVYCVTSQGVRIAKGLTNYSSADMKKIRGKKTAEIERILGYKYTDEAIHRDNLVLI